MSNKDFEFYETSVEWSGCHINELLSYLETKYPNHLSNYDCFVYRTFGSYLKKYDSKQIKLIKRWDLFVPQITLSVDVYILNDKGETLICDYHCFKWLTVDVYEFLDYVPSEPYRVMNSWYSKRGVRSPYWPNDPLNP